MGGDARKSYRQPSSLGPRGVPVAAQDKKISALGNPAEQNSRQEISCQIAIARNRGKPPDEAQRSPQPVGAEKRFQSTQHYWACAALLEKLWMNCTLQAAHLISPKICDLIDDRILITFDVDLDENGS